MAIGAIGAWATAGYFAAGSIGAALVGGAIVGAAVGALTAAVTGGSIGKGILFGAVGGAVMGGISGALGGGGWATAGSQVGETAGTAGSSLSAVGETSRGALSGTFGTASQPSSSIITSNADKAFSIGKFFATQGGGTMGAGLVTTAGTTLAGAFDDTTEEQMKLEREKMELADKQFYANLEAQKEIAGMKSSGGGGSYDPTKVEMAKLAEQRRQFDTTTAIEQAKQERQQASLGGLQAAKEAGVLNYQGVDTEIYNKNKPVYDQEANKPQGVLA